VPGMVEPNTMRILYAPTLGWRNIDLRGPLAEAVGLPVQIENSGRACALAQLWAMHGEAAAADLVFVNVADGLGVGVVIHGEMLRGRNNIAGEFGHVPLSGEGPRCACGATGCWEAYVSNRATMARYFGRPLDADATLPDDQRYFRVEDLIARARAGDVKAVAAVQATGRFLGLGLASIVNAYDPARVYVGGEITAAWDLIEPTVRAGLAERMLTPAATALDLRTVAAIEYPRLQGAAALVTAPAFAAPVVA
jgi:N-acetylglucosamine repressor